jgi:hypothetical protein
MTVNSPLLTFRIHPNAPAHICHTGIHRPLLPNHETAREKSSPTHCQTEKNAWLTGKFQVLELLLKY